MSNCDLFKRYYSELLLRLHNRKNLSDTMKILDKFEAFLDGRLPSIDLAKEFLSQYADRKPRTLL
jgi:hypothetical protein